MGKVNRQTNDPVQALYDAVDALHRQVRDLNARKAIIQVIGSQVIQDGDGGLWINNDDHSIHYVVNGVEYKLTGTPV